MCWSTVTLARWVGTTHFGLVAMWDRLNREFDCIGREIAWMYVKKCAVINAKTLYKRIFFDLNLIDFTIKPSHGYRYIPSHDGLLQRV